MIADRIAAQQEMFLFGQPKSFKTVPQQQHKPLSSGSLLSRVIGKYPPFPTGLSPTRGKPIGGASAHEPRLALTPSRLTRQLDGRKIVPLAA
ncbi:hypothetical protein EN947_13065 [Mesorhizobium sp. M7A.F.Ca.US.003.02.2.1]|nr:hypothetical protein EN947_13065 [Mesorhizobium sp. M7A.F.Ca.US.003.02.2.1]